MKKRLLTELVGFLANSFFFLEGGREFLQSLADINEESWSLLLVSLAKKHQQSCHYNVTVNPVNAAVRAHLSLGDYSREFLCYACKIPVGE